MMRQAVLKAEGVPLDIVEVPLPEVPETGVLVKTLFAGVCASDLGLMRDLQNYGMDPAVG